MAYLIRQLDISDYDELIGLWARSGLSHRPHGRDSREEMRKQFRRKETYILGMFDGNTMIGSIVGTSDGRKAWINRLAVDPDYRGRGLGGKLIAEIEGYLRKHDVRVIAALIEDWNTPSMSVFSNAGYEFFDDVVYCSKRTSPDD